MITTDRHHHGLNKNVPGQQNAAYLVLSKEEIAKGFIRPVRQSYRHLKCGTVTKMNITIAQTYSRQPDYYGATWCMGCGQHLPVGEFVWEGTDQTVGS